MGFLDIFKPNIRKMETKRDVGGLRKSLSHTDPNIRASAAMALGNLGDGAAKSTLVEALKDASEKVRNSVHEALGKLGVREAESVATALQTTVETASQDAGDAVPPRPAEEPKTPVLNGPSATTESRAAEADENDDTSRRQKLIEACGSGDLSEVERLVSAGVKVDCIDDYGATPLMRTAMNGHLAVAEFLLAHGADLRFQRKEGGNALTWAAEGGWKDIVSLFLTHGESLQNLPPTVIYSLAMRDGTAVKQDRVESARIEETVEFLLKNGVDPNGTTKKNGVMWAVLGECVNLLRILLENGADPNMGRMGGPRTPLDICNDRSSWSSSYGQMAQLLSRSGGKSSNGQKQNADDLAEEDEFDLLDGMGDFLEEDENSLLGSLCDAVMNDDLPGVKKSLRKGADPNAVVFEPDDGWTLLHEAIDHNIEILQELLSAGAKINAATHLGYTPLMRATAKGRLDLVKFLYENGADPTARDAAGRSVYDMAETEAVEDYLLEILPSFVRRKYLQIEQYRGFALTPLKPIELGLINLVKPVVGWRINKITVTLADNTKMDVELLDNCIAAIPPEHAGKEIISVAVPDQK